MFRTSNQLLFSLILYKRYHQSLDYNVQTIRLEYYRALPYDVLYTD